MAVSSSSSSPLGKKDRREAARATARLEREAEKKRQRRNRIFLQGGVGVGVLAVVAIVALIVVNSSAPAAPGPKNMASGGIVLTAQNKAIGAVKTGPAPADGSIASPASATTAGKAHIVTYLDWACPACKEFESSSGIKVAALVSNGNAVLEVHPIAILDSKFAGSRYSSRAANVAACVANFAPDSFLKAQTTFYKNQPAESSTGLTNKAMIKLLTDAGIKDPKITKCVNEESFKSWVAQVTRKTAMTKALQGTTAGSFGTPTVLVNGKKWDNATDFMAFAMKSTGSGAPAPVPAPVPAPTPSK